LSREIGMFGAPTLLCSAEGKTEDGVYREPSEGSTRSETLRMRRSPSHRNWEVSLAPDIGLSMKGVSGKAHGHNPEIIAGEKSDACIVPRNGPNNDDASIPSPAEDREGRRAAKRNADQLPAPRTQSRTGASMGLDGVREVARKGRDVRFTALMHHMTPDLLTKSFMHLKRSADALSRGALFDPSEPALPRRDPPQRQFLSRRTPGDCRQAAVGRCPGRAGCKPG
jgi:RNA-directed DNA polymerase